MALDIKQLIQDKSGDRDYFAMVPGLLWPDIKLCSGSSMIEPLPVHIQEIGIELNVHDKWLYASLKKICGETGGQCFLSTRGLAKFAGMSTGQTSKSKTKLEEAGLIEIVCKKRSVRGQAIDHITVVDIWEENIKVMKARKEGVHLVNALREKRERSQKGARRSSDEHLSPERSPSETKCSPSETEEEPIEEEPRGEEEKEEEPPVLPEKPKERTDARQNEPVPSGLDKEDSEAADQHDPGEAVLQRGTPRDPGLPLPDHKGDHEGVGGRVDPLMMPFQRRTAAAQAASGNYADPAQAGGSDAAAHAGLVALHKAKGGSAPREGTGTYVKEMEAIGQALRDRGVTDPRVAILAAQMFVEEKPKLACPHYKSFVGDYGEYLGRACSQSNGTSDRHERYDTPNVRASQAALKKRKAARASPVKDCRIGATIKRELELQMTKATFETWVKPCAFACDDGALVVTAPTTFAKDWLKNRVAVTIRRALAGFADGPQEVRFEVKS